MAWDQNNMADSGATCLSVICCFSELSL